tara:strand:- start:1963 stop:2622 length:660 start_codon:yes stop_codon:yes gene_type:complete
MSDFANPGVLALWLISMDEDFKPISIEEEEWARNLSVNRSRQFKYSRGYVREFLSDLFNLPALEIPLNAPPGKPPELPEGWGNISISHCDDCLLIGWSPKKIGVDIERVDRDLKVDQLLKRYFSTLEIKKFNNLTEEEKRFEVLKQWVIKEAAIKWQRGSIFQDFSKWDLFMNSKQAIHKSLGFITEFYLLKYHRWFLAVSLEKNHHKIKPIFCVKSIL